MKRRFRPSRVLRTVILGSIASIALLAVLALALLSQGELGAAPLPTPTRTSLEMTKQAYEDRYAAAQATAKAGENDPQQRARANQPPPTLVPHSPVSAAPPTPAGSGRIIETGLAPYPGSVYRFSNRWVAEKDGYTIIAYIGALVADPDQGIVVVETRPLTNQIGGEFHTPAKAGAVRVTGASGDRLTLRASNGTLVVFDIDTLTFR